MNSQKIVVAMSSEEDFMPNISKFWHEYAWAKKEIYFIYVVRKDVCVGEISIDETPGRAAQKNITKHLLDLMKNKASEMTTLPTFKQAHFEVLFAQSPADQLAAYVKEINAGMIVVATRNMSGFLRMFSGSFADRLLKLSPCDVLVLRPNKAPCNKPWSINSALIYRLYRWLSASIRPKGRKMLAPGSNVHFLPNRNVRRLLDSIPFENRGDFFKMDKISGKRTLPLGADKKILK